MIWIVEELAKYKLGPEPLARIKIKADEAIIVKEQFKRSTIVTGLTIRFPLGCFGLVHVRFRFGKHFVPENGYVSADDEFITLQTGIKVRKGSYAWVELRNTNSYDHIIGARVDVGGKEECSL